MLAVGRTAPAVDAAACRIGRRAPAARRPGASSATRPASQLIDGIGATEMLHVFISAADDDIRPGATGRAVPGYDAPIVDDDGQPVPDGTPGRLAVKGPTGCRYLADARQKATCEDGWNITGDTFIRDDDGYFWYHARSDDMIISSGYNIAGPEVEEAVAAASGRRRLCSDRCSRRGQRTARHRLRRRSRRRSDRSRAAIALQHARQGDHRSLQVPSGHRVRGRTSAHCDRQAPALPPAPDAVDMTSPCLGHVRDRSASADPHLVWPLRPATSTTGSPSARS